MLIGYGYFLNDGNGSGIVKQLFVLSHNLQFLKYFSNIIHIDNSAREDYFITCDEDSIGLEKQPSVLCNYQTRYFQKLRKILEYIEDDIPYEEARKFLPNYIRNVLETFLSFKLVVLKKGSSNDKYRLPGLKKLINKVNSNLRIFEDYNSVEDVDENSLVKKLWNIKRLTDSGSHGNVQNVTNLLALTEKELDVIANDTVNIIRFLDNIHIVNTKNKLS